MNHIIRHLEQLLIIDNEIRRPKLLLVVKAKVKKDGIKRINVSLIVILGE